MIHLKQNIKQEDAQWVLEFVMPKQGWRIDRTTLGYVADAHNKIFEEQVGVSGCSCEFVAQHGVWYSRLNQYRSQIEEAAYPPVVTETGTTGKSTGKTTTTGKSSRKPKSNSGLTD